MFYSIVMNDHPASWRIPNPKQVEKLARERDRMAPETCLPTPDQPLPAEWWDSVLADPRAAGKPWLPIEQRRVSEVPRDCCGSSAYAVAVWSRYIRRTRSDYMDRTRFGKTLANVCSMTDVSTVPDVTRKMAVGRTGYDDLRCAQRSPRPPDRSRGS
jgi:hypothetical protein